jgi:YhcH/YjgK/YiaL family protein
MIIDKIEKSELYKNLHPGFQKAFEFINDNDISSLEDGKYEIEGDNIFALVQEYNTKDKEDAKLEGHIKYIDIQYINFGKELVGVAPLNEQAIVSNDAEKDYAFYDGEASFIKLEKGMFAIFFPHDLHMPGIKINESTKVKKVVVKVKI